MNLLAHTLRFGSPSRSLAFVLSLSFSTSAALLTRPVVAQEATQAENIAAARALGIQGIQLADAGNCKAAMEKLSRAEALYHAPTILGRLGECQVQVGQVVLGTENLNRVVREQLAPNAPKAFRDAQERARGVLNSALPKIARLTVSVEPAEAKPQVTVSGATIPAALIGAERPTDPGTHEVVVSAPGYLEQRRSVTLAEGGSQEIAVRLEKDPNAVVETPTQPSAVTGDTASPVASDPAVDAGTKRSNTLAYVALGVGGAGLLLGGVTGVLALGKKSDLQGCDGTRCPESQRDTLDSANSMATLSTVGFGVGIVGVGLGVVLLVTNSGSASAPASRALAKSGGVNLEPFIGIDRAGVRGRF
jgi:hypothetical protein